MVYNEKEINKEFKKMLEDAKIITKKLKDNLTDELKSILEYSCEEDIIEFIHN